jgi:hypothetical protein
MAIMAKMAQKRVFSRFRGRFLPQVIELALPIGRASLFRNLEKPRRKHGVPLRKLWHIYSTKVWSEFALFCAILRFGPSGLLLPSRHHVGHHVLYKPIRISRRRWEKNSAAKFAIDP